MKRGSNPSAGDILHAFSAGTREAFLGISQEVSHSTQSPKWGGILAVSRTWRVESRLRQAKCISGQAIFKCLVGANNCYSFSEYAGQLADLLTKIFKASRPSDCRSNHVVTIKEKTKDKKTPPETTNHGKTSKQAGSQRTEMTSTPGWWLFNDGGGIRHPPMLDLTSSVPRLRTRAQDGLASSMP